MIEDTVDHQGLGAEGEDVHLLPAARTGERIHLEDAAQQLGPAAGRPERLGEGLVGFVGAGCPEGLSELGLLDLDAPEEREEQPTDRPGERAHAWVRLRDYVPARYRNQPGSVVVRAGMYVISNTPISSTMNIGMTDRITMGTGFPKR